MPYPMGRSFLGLLYRSIENIFWDITEANTEIISDIYDSEQYEPD